MDFLKPKETPKGANIGDGSQTSGITQQPDVPQLTWLKRTGPMPDNKHNLNVQPPGNQSRKGK